jgi:hypothetical protein
VLIARGVVKNLDSELFGQRLLEKEKARWRAMLQRWSPGVYAGWTLLAVVGGPSAVQLSYATLQLANRALLHTFGYCSKRGKEKLEYNSKEKTYGSWHKIQVVQPGWVGQGWIVKRPSLSVPGKDAKPPYTHTLLLPDESHWLPLEFRELGGKLKFKLEKP